jgi:hypothetical protein
MEDLCLFCSLVPEGSKLVGKWKDWAILKIRSWIKAKFFCFVFIWVWSICYVSFALGEDRCYARRGVVRDGQFAEHNPTVDSLLINHNLHAWNQINGLVFSRDANLVQFTEHWILCATSWILHCADGKEAKELEIIAEACCLKWIVKTRLIVIERLTSSNPRP